ncbi:MAG: helix-turn-helix domain-containing protein [Heteroscytonema crispum UTEX LB 1556]
MATKAERLAELIKGLRGATSQRRFSQQLGVSKSCVNFWESGLAFPDTGNLEKLAALKGWTLAELQTYLVKGELPSDDTLQQIITKLRSLPTEAVVQVVSVGVETLASRSQSVQAVIK